MAVGLLLLGLVLCGGGGGAEAFAAQARPPRAAAPSMSLKVGDKFPAKALKAWGVAGKSAVLYFYSADETPTCTKQAVRPLSPSCDARFIPTIMHCRPPPTPAALPHLPSVPLEIPLPQDAFSSQLDAFKAAGCTVVGIRGDSGVKGDFASKYGQKFVVDEGNAVRREIGIKADLLGAIPGRETYVVDKAGTVTFVFNNQFDAKAHVTKALAASQALKGASSGRPKFFGK